MTSRCTPSAILLLLAAACATPQPDGAYEAAPYQELRQFQQHQQVFREQHTVPQVLDFPGQERITVRDVSLDGFPGNTYVRCRFHLQNRSAKPIVQSWVFLDVYDADGRLAGRSGTVCIVPHPIPLARGSFFADELRTQTRDAHLQPGWTWKIHCVSQLEEDEEPLVPPVPEVRQQPLAPVEVKQRPIRWN